MSIITTIAAFGGFVLGIINLVRAVWHDRVRIVASVYVRSHSVDGDFVGVEIRNLSYIPVTIEKVGFSRKFTTGTLRIHRCSVSENIIGDLPQMMQPKTRMVVEGPLVPADYAAFSDFYFVTVTTACGCTVTADAATVRDYIKPRLNPSKP